MRKPKRIAIIDADSILYAIALGAEMCCKKQGADGEDIWFEVRGLEPCYHDLVEDRLVERLEAIQADDAYLCLSDRRCFRYDVLPTYKANRAATRRPPMMVKLREALIERQPWKVLNIATLEADDVAGIMGTTLRAAGTDAIIMSDDKDLLTIPGVIHHRGDTFEVTIEEADRNHLYQTLVGDYVDGYTGLPTVGPKRANAILDSAASQSVADLWAATLGAYIARGLSEEDALQQARTARILRNTDWDATTKSVKLWTPPQRVAPSLEIAA